MKTVANYVDGSYESGIPDEDVITETTYDKTGRVVETVDARGTGTAFGYDAAGRRVSVTRAAGSPWAATSYTCYDRAGRVLRVIANWTAREDDPSPDAKDANGDWLFAPDDHGRFDDRDLVIAYAYDAAGRRALAVQNVYFDGVIDTDLGNWEWVAGAWEDGSGNPIPSGANGDRNIVTSAPVYDKAGQVVSERDPEGVASCYVYDQLRRLRRVVQHWVDNGEDPADWLWDGGDERWEQSDGTPIVHGDENDQNVIVDVVLDLAGRRTALRDPRGEQTTYQHDRLSRRTQLTNPISKTWQTAYSDVSGGQRTDLTDAASQVTRRETDRLGRVKAISYLSESPKYTPDVTFEHDLAGNRTKMSEDDGSPVRETIYHYDLAQPRLGRARRLTKVEFDTDGDGQVEQSVSYAYDGSGPRTKLVLPDGKTIAYAYDVNGRLVRAVDWDGQSARYAWDLAGRLVGVERSNAFESYYRNDAGGRLRSLKHVYRGDTVAQFDYIVDARGNRTQAVETILQPDDSADVHTIDYVYDALSRLLQAQYANGGGVFRQYDYEYDLAGNRTQRVETISGNPTATRKSDTYNAANQLVSDGTNTLTYDDNGNLTSDGTNGYTWDRANRLLNMGGSSYAYDGVGRRVSQTVSSIVTEYLLDVQPSLAVVLAASTPGETTRFVHGPRGLERQQQHSGAWLFPVQDGLGSVRGMLDNDWPSADVLGTRQYAPYGVPFGAEGTVDTPFGFTGEQVDGNELVHLRARYYAPGLGVFISRDPWDGSIRRAMSLNGYSWVEGNVVNDADPSGKITSYNAASILSSGTCVQPDDPHSRCWCIADVSCSEYQICMTCATGASSDPICNDYPFCDTTEYQVYNRGSMTENQLMLEWYAERGIAWSPPPPGSFCRIYSPPALLPPIEYYAPIFGPGVVPAKMGSYSIGHTGDEEYPYPPTIDVIPAYAESCVDQAACGEYNDEPIKIYAPVSGCLVQGREVTSEATLEIGVSCDNRLSPRIEIHFAHLYPVSINSGDVKKGDEIGRLCTRQEVEQDHTKCGFERDTETHLAINIRRRGANGLIEEPFPDTTPDFYWLLPNLVDEW